MIVTQSIREEWFTAEELAVANAFKLRKRRDEWLRARTAAKELALHRRLVRDPRMCLVGRPRLILDGEESPWFVSLSHSKGWGAAIIGREPVGIDIEMVRDFDERAVHLYLSDDETEVMRLCTIDHRALHFWCAKEAAWKQRSSEFETMRQLPLKLLGPREDGLLFDAARTMRYGELILAVTTSRAEP